jgi:hypothetical protein
VVSVLEDGLLEVVVDGGSIWRCELLINDLTPPTPGDRVVVLPPADSGDCAVVLGRIGRSGSQQPRAKVNIEATESLTLKCGEASVELRADGKAMVKGDDVLIRAKGMQRIRAGTVSIN